MAVVATFNNTKPNVGVAGTFQGSAPSVQGTNPILQAGAATPQGSSPNLQPTVNPMNYSTGGATTTPPRVPVVDNTAALLEARANPLLAAFGALGVARDTSRGAAEADFGNVIKQYDDQFKIDQGRYGEQVTENEKTLTGNRQAARLQAAQGGAGLRAILAAMGALNGTGSILADRAISQAANNDIGDAQNTFETNATTLTNAFADTEAQDRQRRAQAEAARTAAFNNADTSFFNNKIDILGKLANIFGADTARGAGYANEAASLYPEVARIPQGQPVSYTPVSSLYNPATLSKYLAGTNDLTVSTAAGNAQPSAPGVIATVQKRKDELS